MKMKEGETSVFTLGYTERSVPTTMVRKEGGRVGGKDGQDGRKKGMEDGGKKEMEGRKGWKGRKD
jgi:hypothetical protein